MYPLLLSSLLLASPASPAWLDHSLAGYLDSKHSEVGIFDSKKGYYFTRTSECDGAITCLNLTRDRRVVRDAGFDVPGFRDRSESTGQPVVTTKTLRSLSTGKGVSIGDTPGQVVARLGKPSKAKRTGTGGQFLEYRYHWRTTDQTYTFKAGKLIEISFFRDDSPG